jgi:hypothetical protein
MAESAATTRGCRANPRRARWIACKGGFQNGHLVRRTQAVRCEDAVHGGSEVHLRKRAARFLGRLSRQPHAKAGTTRGPTERPLFVHNAGASVQSKLADWTGTERARGVTEATEKEG